MSVEAMSYVLNTKVGDSTRKLILLGYANHAHRDGTAAWPSVDTIAEYADCSGRTVQRHLRLLVDEGFMREGDQALVAHLRGDRRPVVYDLSLTEQQRDLWAAEARGDISSPGDRGDTDEADVTNGVTPEVARGDAAVSPEPSMNHPDAEPSPSLRSGPDKAKRGTRLPEDWQPSDALKDWFREHTELHSINPVAETEKFKDYWAAQPGQRGVKLDWDGTWRNWMRTGAERRTGTRPHHPQVDAGHRESVGGLF